MCVFAQNRITSISHHLQTLISVCAPTISPLIMFRIDHHAFIWRTPTDPWMPAWQTLLVEFAPLSCSFVLPASCPFPVLATEWRYLKAQWPRTTRLEALWQQAVCPLFRRIGHPPQRPRIEDVFTTLLLKVKFQDSVISFTLVSSSCNRWNGINNHQTWFLQETFKSSGPAPAAIICQSVHSTSFIIVERIPT